MPLPAPHQAAVRRGAAKRLTPPPVSPLRSGSKRPPASLFADCRGRSLPDPYPFPTRPVVPPSVPRRHRETKLRPTVGKSIHLLERWNNRVYWEHAAGSWASQSFRGPALGCLRHASGCRCLSLHPHGPDPSRRRHRFGIAILNRIRECTARFHQHAQTRYADRGENMIRQVAQP